MDGTCVRAGLRRLCIGLGIRRIGGDISEAAVYGNVFCLQTVSIGEVNRKPQSVARIMQSVIAWTVKQHDL